MRTPSFWIVADHTDAAECGANLLVVNILGIIVGLIMLGFGIDAAMRAHTSTKAAAAQTIVTNIANKMQAYVNDHGAAPPGSVDAWDSATFVGNTKYFGTPPTDPLCACSAGAFGIYSATTGLQQMLVIDWNKYPARTLNGLPRSTWNGTQMVMLSTCNNDCTAFLWVSGYGMTGYPL